MNDLPDSPGTSYPAPETVSSLISHSLPPNWKYETTVADIEAIIDRIERGELELAEVFDQFAIAVEQLRYCELFLTRQQQQVDLLIETLLDEPDPF